MSFAYTGAGSDDAESIRTIHRALELGVTFIDTAEIYGPYTNEELVGRALKGRRDQVVLGHQVRDDLPHRRRSGQPRQQPRQHPHRGRRVAAPPRHRLHRPVLPAPRRPRTRPSRTPSAPWPSWSPRARSATSGCPRPGGTPSAAPTPCTRSPRCSRSTRCGPATPNRRCCRCCASSASASCLLAARPRLPHRRDPLDGRARRRRLAQDQPPLHGRELPAQPAHRRRGRSRRRRGRCHAGAGRHRLAAAQRRRHRPDPRHQARFPASRRTSPPTASSSPPSSSTTRQPPPARRRPPQRAQMQMIDR